MDAEEVGRIVERGVREGAEMVHDLGVDLDASLVRPPVLAPFVDDATGERVWLWKVFALVDDGYVMVFDPKARCFGLGMPMADGSVLYLGPFGTFADALDAM